MRPKKRILIVSADEQRGSLLRFMLATNGYAADVAAPGREIFAAAEQFRPELLLLAWPVPEAEKLVARIRGQFPAVAVLVLAKRPDELTERCDAQQVIIEKSDMAFLLLDRLKVLCVRKRGPCKGTQKAEPAWPELAEKAVA